jgi:hypothetical protein
MEFAVYNAEGSLVVVLRHMTSIRVGMDTLAKVVGLSSVCEGVQMRQN